jgi:spore germination protein KC
MKNILLLLFVCGLTVILSGCWDRVELNDLAIVTAAGIDMDNSNQTKLTIQIFIPKMLSNGGGQGVGGGAGGGTVTIVKTEQGINLADALSKLQTNLPRKIFWGQCKVFILAKK